MCPCLPNRASQSIHSPTDFGASFPCKPLPIAWWTHGLGAKAGAHWIVRELSLLVRCIESILRLRGFDFESLTRVSARLSARG